jgi:hypothetical protein
VNVNEEKPSCPAFGRSVRVSGRTRTLEN